MTPRRVTIESSLQIFQYNLLNNCVYMNNRLSKFDQNISPLCSLCNEVPEEMLHFFCLSSRFPLSQKGGRTGWEGGVGGRGVCLHIAWMCSVCKCVVCKCWCDVYVLVMCSVLCVY